MPNRKVFFNTIIFPWRRLMSEHRNSRSPCPALFARRRRGSHNRRRRFGLNSFSLHDLPGDLPQTLCERTVLQLWIFLGHLTSRAVAEVPQAVVYGSTRSSDPRKGVTWAAGT